MVSLISLQFSTDSGRFAPASKEVLETGVSAYLRRTTTSNRVKQCIRQFAAGQKFIPNFLTFLAAEGKAELACDVNHFSTLIAAYCLNDLCTQFGVAVDFGDELVDCLHGHGHPLIKKIYMSA